MDIEKLCLGCMKELKQPGICPRCGYNSAAAKAEGHYLRPYTILNGKYLVGRVLGEGGFGITYIGYDLNLEMPVAVKEFYPNGFVTRESGVTSLVSVYQGANMEAIQKWKNNFIKEARTLAKCAHLSGIVGVKDFFEENGTAYIVMEYLEGMTLKAYVKSCGGRVDAGQLLKCLEPVMASLAKVHEYGLIHRDISPDNIMLLEGGSMKLLDFGAARDYAAGDERSLSVMLKPGYAPEEQYRTKGKQGPWSDVYAFCATIYKCITGMTPPESMERMRQDDLKRPSALGISLSPQTEAAILKGMAVYAENRYQSMPELMTALFAGNRERTTASSPTQSQTVSQTTQDSAAVVNSLPVTGQGGEDKAIQESVLTRIQAVGREHWKMIAAAAGAALFIIILSGAMGRDSGDTTEEAQVQDTAGEVQSVEADAEEAPTQEPAAAEQKDSPGQSAEDLLQQGRELIEAGDYDTAFACLEAARETAPDQEEIYSYESDIYLAKGDIENAVGILEEGVEATGKMTLDTRKSYILQNTILLKEELYLGDVLIRATAYDEDGNMIRREYYTESGYDDGWTEYGYENGLLSYEVSCYANEEVKSGVYYEDGLESGGYSCDELGRQTQSYSCEYDGQGHMARRVFYDADGAVSWWKVYEYDQNGNQIKDSSYNSDGSLNSWQEYAYGEDNRALSYRAYYADGRRSGSGEYQYDDKGNRTAHVDYDADGYESWREEYEYNALGKVSRSRHYDGGSSDASYVNDYIYTYEFLGN